MSKVRALEPGYDNLARRDTGEVFDWPDTLKVDGKDVENPIPSWCEPVEEKAAGKKAVGKDLA